MVKPAKDTYSGDFYQFLCEALDSPVQFFLNQVSFVTNASFFDGI